MKTKLCTAEALRRLVVPFFEANEPVVHLARCCGVVFVGVQPVDRCRTCQKAPTNHECRSVEDALKHADPEGT